MAASLKNCSGESGSWLFGSTEIPTKRYRYGALVETQPSLPRRVLVATVRGALGERIQAWRERYDPKHAARLPPHLTLCYRPPLDAPLSAIEAQVRHAFHTPVAVRLGAVFVLQHREAPL